VQWFIPVIPNTWKAEVRRIEVQGKKLARSHHNQQAGCDVAHRRHKQEDHSLGHSREKTQTLFKK
jgi:hypothetical protein